MKYFNYNKRFTSGYLSMKYPHIFEPFPIEWDDNS